MEQAVEEQVSGGKERAAAGGRIIVNADRNIIAPHQESDRGGIVLHPAIVETQDRIEMRLQPFYVSTLIAGE